MALSDYALVPVINNPTEGVIDGWLEIGSNATGRNRWLSTTYSSNLVKCAYYKGSIDSDYYIAMMTYSETNPLRAIYTNSYYDFSYHLIRYTFVLYNSGVNLVYSDGIGNTIQSLLNSSIPLYNTKQEALAAMDDGIWDYAPTAYPITYRLTNATTTGPIEAAVGDTVTVPLTFPEGYGVVNPSSDAYVTCNGVLVPSTYSDGQLVFTMPDPS